MRDCYIIHITLINCTKTFACSFCVCKWHIYSSRFLRFALAKDALIMCKRCLTLESNFMMRLNTKFGGEIAWSHWNKLIYCFLFFCQYYNNTIATKVWQLELTVVLLQCLLCLTSQAIFGIFSDIHSHSKICAFSS